MANEDFNEWLTRVLDQPEEIPEVRLVVGDQEYLLKGVTCKTEIGPIGDDGVCEEITIEFIDGEATT